MTDNVSSHGQADPQATVVNSAAPPLSDVTEQALKDYFDKLNGHQPVALYNFVMGEVERPLFRTVLEFTRGNQSRAAELLGINRGTLRKKLKNYGLSG
ncbi:MAG: DNA-binding transcriptional regulator Fis [Pseudomonadota bacterium]